MIAGGDNAYGSCRRCLTGFALGASMIGKPDFFSFYQQLGLHPNCSEEELKNAYRRRVAELHPDREVGRGDPANALRLQELTAAYNAATTFQRRYGRLPGAQHLGTRSAALPHGNPLPPDVVPIHSSGLRHVALLAFALVVLAWFLWDNFAADLTEQPQDGRPDPTSFAAVPSGVQEQSHPTEAHLHLGMGTDEVRAIEGKPVMANTARWDYGPSWIEFDHDKVSDWYSSRLRPLKVTTARPLAASTRP